MRRENYRRKTNRPGHQPNACMPLLSSPRILYDVCSYVEIFFLRHPSYASRSKSIVLICRGYRRPRLAKRSTFKNFSMIIGPLKPMSSHYSVSSVHEPSSLIVDQEAQRALPLESIVALSNCASLQYLPIVFSAPAHRE